MNSKKQIDEGIIKLLKNVTLLFTTIIPVGILPREIQAAFPGESQLRQSHTTQPTVQAGCCSVSIIHQTLTWTTGSLTCTQMLMYVIAQGGVQTQ